MEITTIIKKVIIFQKSLIPIFNTSLILITFDNSQHANTNYSKGYFILKTGFKR